MEPRADYRLDRVFGFFGFFGRIHQLTTGIDQARGHGDDQVPFDVLLSVLSDEAAKSAFNRELPVRLTRDIRIAA